MPDLKHIILPNMNVKLRCWAQGIVRQQIWGELVVYTFE